MYACLQASTAASYDQAKFMEGWYDKQVLDFIHHNAEIIDKDQIDEAIGANGGHKYGCWSHGLTAKDDEILPYNGCSFHQAFLQSHCAVDGTDTQQSGVRCLELKLAPSGRTGREDRGSPHNEWICSLPSWTEVVPMIQAELQD